MDFVSWILIGLAVLIILSLISIYNKLVKLKVRSEEAWSDIEVQLKRRYDLIPNLVETVKGYAKHEKEAFENVTKARAEALSAKGVKDHERAENQLEGALKSIFAVAEAYPELKANENFVELQKEITDTEDKIQASRRFYNANVRELNITIQSFPVNMLAKPFGFSEKELFELEERAMAEPVKVKFD